MGGIYRAGNGRCCRSDTREVAGGLRPRSRHRAWWRDWFGAGSGVPGCSGAGSFIPYGRCSLARRDTSIRASAGIASGVADTARHSGKAQRWFNRQRRLSWSGIPPPAAVAAHQAPRHVHGVRSELAPGPGTSPARNRTGPGPLRSGTQFALLVLHPTGQRPENARCRNSAVARLGRQEDRHRAAKGPGTQPRTIR